MGSAASSKLNPGLGPQKGRSTRAINELDLIAFYRSTEGHYLRESFIQYLTSKPSFLKKYFFLYEILIELYQQETYSKNSFLHIAIFLNEHAIDKYMKTMTLYLSAESIQTLTTMKQTHCINLQQLQYVINEVHSHFNDILISFQKQNLHLQYDMSSSNEPKKTVLIVAKNSPFIRILRKLLPHSNYDTVHVCSPYDALVDLEVIQYQVVLIEKSPDDIDPMQFYKGYLEIEARVQAKFNNYQKPQFILLSNEVDCESIESYIESGFRGALPVPFHLSSLKPLSEPEPLLDAIHRSMRRLIPSTISKLPTMLAPSACSGRDIIKTIVD